MSTFSRVHMCCPPSHWIIVNFILFCCIFQSWNKNVISSVLFPFSLAPIVFMYILLLHDFILSFPPISPVPFYSLFLLNLCQWECRFLQFSHCHGTTRVRSSSSGEHGTEREGICSGLQRALSSGLPGPTAPCSLTYESAHTRPETGQAPKAKQDASLGQGLLSDLPGLGAYFKVVTLLWQKLGFPFCILNIRVSALLIYSQKLGCLSPKYCSLHLAISRICLQM